MNIRNTEVLWCFQKGSSVRIQESGKWKGKPTISKKGNSHIRRLMYMPTLSSIQYANTYKTIYNRIKDRKEHNMVAVVAIQRKLLGLIYTLWKNDSAYIENYQKTETV